MPEFVLPAEADRCPHCDAVLTAPPGCCDKAKQEHHQYLLDSLPDVAGDPVWDMPAWEVPDGDKV